jgi:hypothetical protein
LRNFVSTLLITYNCSLHFVGNKLGEKLTHIQESLLKRHDPALFLRLEKLEIYPQLYGIRQVALFSSFKHFLRGGAEILVTLWLMSDGQHYFKKISHDPVLFLRLETLEIYPQLYGIRQVALFSSFIVYLWGREQKLSYFVVD